MDKKSESYEPVIYFPKGLPKRDIESCLKEIISCNREKAGLCYYESNKS